jgi:hypothetical protein
MNASELKQYVERVGSDFFDRKTMRFFGDTMANYRVRSATIDTCTRKNVECWELWRKRPVKDGLQNSAYFSKETFERVFPKID